MHTYNKTHLIGITRLQLIVFKLQGNYTQMISDMACLLDPIDVHGLFCVNNEEKSGAVLGYFLCISQLNFQKARGPNFLSPSHHQFQSPTGFKSGSTLRASLSLNLIG